MKAQVAALLLSASLCAHAQTPEWVEPVLVVGAVLAVQQSGALEGKCVADPCNSIGHMATGAAVSYYVGKRYGWEAGVLSAIAVGVGKELLDKNFDAKDAAMTSLGGIAVRWVWEF